MTLCRVTFQGQRGEDVLDINLFGEDELGVRLAGRLEQRLLVVLAWVLEAVQRSHFAADVFVARTRGDGVIAASAFRARCSLKSNMLTVHQRRESNRPTTGF